MKKIKALWGAVKRERPGPDWLLKVPGAKHIVAAKRYSWYLRNARWFLHTARCVVYNSYRTSNRRLWSEAQVYVYAVGAEAGLQRFFAHYPSKDYSWFRDNYLGDAVKSARVFAKELDIGKLRRWQ